MSTDLENPSSAQERFCKSHAATSCGSKGDSMLNQGLNHNWYAVHTRHQHACRETFLRVGAPFGIGARQLGHNINFFMNVPLTSQGGLTFEDGMSAPGKYVEIRAERDLLVLISNCPQLNNPCNGWDPTPIRLRGRWPV